MYPKNFLDLTPKEHLKALSSQLVSPQDLKDILEIVNMLGFQLTLNHRIIYINLNVFS